MATDPINTLTENTSLADKKTITGSDVSTKRAMDVRPLTGLVDFNWDYVSLAQTSTTDTYTFRIGGSSGSIQGVVAITYTDASKGTIDNVERTT